MTDNERLGGAIYAEMSLRDYFAGQCLTTCFDLHDGDTSYSDLAKMAYAQADAMMEARKQNGTT